MSFALIAVISIVALGAIAAICSIGDADEPIKTAEGNCATCGSRDDCKLAELVERKNALHNGCHDNQRQQDGCDSQEQSSNSQTQGSGLRSLCLLVAVLASLSFLVSCSTHKNTPRSRFWQSFTARYNTYFNGSQAFIEGSIEKENGNKDNYTEVIPLYTVGNKKSRDLGKSQFARAIEKSEKTIKQHSIKARPEWNKSRRKTQKDIEWLSRREYNPFLWRAWLLLGKSQFQQGQFEEAAATFSYMTRLYATQPAILGIARAWQAKSYTELDWLYDAEDIIAKQRRDSMHFRAVKDWDYTYADYYIRSQRYEEAIPWLRKVIRHEHRRKQKAREWFLLGQLEAALGHRTQAYDAFKHVVRLSPPYELEFNARIAQTEVMAASNSKRMVSRLKRMATNDNNQDFLDQVYYAIGNIYIAQRDTIHAIEAYETGVKKATRSGIEKGVLLLTLGNLYWEREKYADAQRCYGEAIGLLDKDRKDYRLLAERSKILDELAPHTSAVELQDSLQRLARMSEQDRNRVIDQLIAELVKKEKEERRAQEEAEAEKVLAQQSAVGNRQQTNQPTPQQTAANGLWYFYNPQAVNQGKQTFMQQWGRRENTDNWQRINQTVVATTNMMDTTQDDSAEDDENETDNDAESNDSATTDADADTKPAEGTDSLANDPHQREYYLAQIPFTEEQLAASNDQIKDGLFHAGIIFKDKMENLSLADKSLTRLVNQYSDYAQTDEALYHLFLLYSRLGRPEAGLMLERLQQDYPESQWTVLLADPHFAENQRFGVHIEDSLYAATYDAFKADRHDEVRANAQLSESRFPLGQHRPKFLFVEGLSLLNTGDAAACTERMKQVVENYPQSEVSEMAGMIIRGVQQGRQLYGGKFDMNDIWTRRSISMTLDSTLTDTLRFERNVSYVFMLAYQPDSVNQNQLLYEMARHNFSNYLVRNFDIVTDQDANGLCRMLVSGFLSYDEARQYARQLYSTEGALSSLLTHCRSLIVSESNLRLLGTTYSYRDYEIFFEQQMAPVEVSPIPLLDEPEIIMQEEEEEESDTTETQPDSQLPASNNDATDDLFNDGPIQQQGGYIEFDDDFWR